MNIRRLLNNILRHNFYQINMLSCWSCGHDGKLVSNLFCSSCKALQKPIDSHNYFDVMGVRETYDLDDSELAKKYKELQKYLHPDKFANKSEKELEISEKYSSLVNEAYRTLLEPLARGVYMLKLRGKEIPETTDIDQSFLMEVMERSEEVESAEKDEEIMKLNAENKSIISELQKQVSKAFFEGDLQKVIKLLTRIKYYTSIDNQIQSAIRRKGIIR